MEVAPKPENEEQRIEALNNYNILDSFPEKEYDEITRLASFICDTPIALVSLVDQNRQWFKSKIGLDASETPRDVAFCAHAILQPEEPFIIENSDIDTRFADNPLVIGDPNVKFYAGCQLNTPSGESLGTLCVIDSIARKITPRQTEALKILANNVVNLLELRKAKLEQKQLIEQLRDSNDELEQFAYIASHDLQEPLRVISSYVQLLSRKYKGKLDTKADKFIEYTVDGCSRMEALIDGLLKFSRVGTNKSNKKLHSCHDILKDVANDLKVRITESNAKISWDELPEIFADKAQIAIVFQNLIKNGIKYNKNEIPVIEIKCEQSENLWEFTLQDNGIGIEKKYHQSIFKLFKRLHSISDYTGTGIGLSICKKIIEHHGGSIKVESKKNEGSKFIFTLPIYKNDSRLLENKIAA